MQLKNDQKIIGFRNRLVHGYDKIDNSIVWAILQKHLPLIQEEVEKIKRMDTIEGKHYHLSRGHLKLITYEFKLFLKVRQGMLNNIPLNCPFYSEILVNQ